MQRYLILIFIVLVVYQCRQTDNKGALKSASDETLARTYCGSCHIFPEPELLPKQVWLKKVMPNMATRMGFKRGFPYDKLDADEIEYVVKAHVIPDSAVLSEEDMFKIVQYYAKHAPEKPIPQKRDIEPQADLSFFKIVNPTNTSLSTQNIMLKPLPDEGKIVLGFEDKGTWLYDIKSKKSELILQAACSDAQLRGGKLYLLDMLSTKAYNMPKGCLWAVDWRNGRPTGQAQKLIDGLKRPVSMDVADVNNDNIPDFIICEFGDYLGQLTLYLSSSQGYKPTVLKPYPGACKAYFKDMNKDGKMDIIALMSQGREEICLFFNKGNDSDFEEKTVAQFPSCYGSNAMEIADINQDGLLDIITTNGDNADMSYSLKAYHGVRIFQNDGTGDFKQTWFYPIYGASNLTVSDFDKDGSIDIAVIAHFPNFSSKNPENFLFFKGNKTNNTFKPYQFSKPLDGRLLTMAKMDMDNDGDEDILIGNFLDILTPVPNDIYQNWQKQAHDWWFLENKTR